jgi:malate permease and related proteins
LSNLLGLFWNNLLPIFIIAGIGYAVGRWRQIDPKPLSQVIFYILTPALIFDLIAKSEMQSADIFKMGAVTILTTLLLAGLAWFASRIIKLRRTLIAAVILVSIMPNAGNYGLSVNLFAFGEEALAHATVFFSFSVIMMYTLGVFVASLGQTDLKGSFLVLARVPAVYAVVAGILALMLNLQLPLPLDRSLTLLSNATIPAMLLLLGLQFRGLQRNSHPKALATATVLRLVISPVLAFGFGMVFALQGSAIQAAVTEAAMPTAVTSTVLATEYDLEPAFIANVVFYTTIISPLTLTPLLALLG